MNNKGSKWYKWDLHVHTPESIYHCFEGGNKELQWERYIQDIENLPSEIKAIGINDYFTIEGYKRIKEEHAKGRMSNIELFLPVIELRTSDFGGNERFSRINYHIIFSDELDIEDIQKHFINRLRTSYELDDGSSWNGGVAHSDLIRLGNEITRTMPKDKDTQKSSPLMIGFSNFNMPLVEVKKILSDEKLFTGKYLTSIGKSEWYDLKWTNNTIANKKSLINSTNFVFTSAPDLESFFKSKKSLKESNVNNRLIDASDAHYNTSSSEKDKIGKGFTWIKAALTFKGLQQAYTEFEDRVFVGIKPDKLKFAQLHPEKFISSIELLPDLDQNGFFQKQKIPLNMDMVAIIGNKGNGKSALADIIGLLGDTKNYTDFSFLTSKKFRKGKLADNFSVKITWENNENKIRKLSEDPDFEAFERVKYLPQQYIEKLCNDLQKDEFEKELKKVIFSHIPSHERLGVNNLDQLISLKTSTHQKDLVRLRNELKDVNLKILEIEDFRSENNVLKLKNELVVLSNNLMVHQTNKPQEVPIVDGAENIVEGDIRKKKEILEQIQEKLNTTSKSISQIKADLLNLTSLNNETLNLIKESNLIKEKYKYLFEDIESILDISYDKGLVHNKMLKFEKAINELTAELEEFESQKNNLTIEIKNLNNKLDEPARLRQDFVVNLNNWKDKEKEIIDRKNELENSLENINDELPKRLNEFFYKRKNLCELIFQSLIKINNEYKALYSPVTEFVKNHEMKYLNLKFESQLYIEDLQEGILRFINQTKKTKLKHDPKGISFIDTIVEEVNLDNFDEFNKSMLSLIELELKKDISNETEALSYLLKPTQKPLDFINWLYSLEFIIPKYTLKMGDKDLDSLSPGEKGSLLLIFYLLIDKDNIPLIIDQPEENLDNQTIFDLLVPAIKIAKNKRQVIIVTHNPNLAVVCDAEQIIFASMQKDDNNKISYLSGPIEDSRINVCLMDVLEGTAPAFNNRGTKYALANK